MEKIEEICTDNNTFENIVEEVYHSDDDEFKYSELEVELENKSSQLSNRVESLKSVIKDMKEKLNEEKDLWRKEMDYATKITESIESECCCLDNTSSVTELSDSVSVSEPSLNEFSLLDFEKKYSVCEDVLKKSSIERRMTVRRQLAANAYKQRLMEIENMCSLELMKVKQNVQFLQPLQHIINEWSFDLKEPDLAPRDEEMRSEKSDPKSESAFMTLENLGHKIEEEIKELKTYSACSSFFVDGEMEELLDKTEQSEVSLKSDEIEAA